MNHPAPTFAAMVAVLAALSMADAPVRAAEHQILGKVFAVRERRFSEDSVRRPVRVVGREASTDVGGIVGNPVADGATLRLIVKGGDTGEDTIDLPAASWRATRYGFRYVGLANSPIRKVVLKRTPRGTARLSVVTNPFEMIHLRPPNPGTEGGLILTLNGGDTYCVSLGGAAGGTILFDTERSWRIRNATAEPGCITPPPPACCIQFGYCSWETSTIACRDMNVTPGPSGSVCNSATGGCGPPPATAGLCCQGLFKCWAGPFFGIPGLCSAPGNTLVPNGICDPSGSCSPSGAFLDDCPAGALLDDCS